MKTIKHGDKVRMKGYSNPWFTAGSIEGYAIETKRDPAKVIAEARAEGFEVEAWFNHDSVTLSDTPVARPVADHECELGEVIEMEGRTYVLALAANDNVKLVPTET